MELDKLLKNAKVIAILCNQWGDSGKGKYSDYFSFFWADVTARGTGGNNAGHTVVVNGRERIYHLIPAGIVNDSLGKFTILGNGMVIDLAVLSSELDDLDKEKMSYNNLMISSQANVIMPYHIRRDRAKDAEQKGGGIGSTGRGIGPCYGDKIIRKGVSIDDLFDRDKLSKKIEKAKEFYPEQKDEIKVDDIIDSLMPFAERIKPFVRDTVAEMHGFMRAGKKILLEGAQGLLLSIEHGTYPYVTSSDCSLNGTASGVGISAKMVDLPLGIIKFPFMTRVGAGPFPTELGGMHSEKYCADGKHTKSYELSNFGVPFRSAGDEIKYNRRDQIIIDMINSRTSEFIQGVGIRLTANEYGATTGRPRRTGWTDAVAAKYAVGINGPLFILTKPDSVSDLEEFKLCFDYGNGIDTFCREEEFLREAKPNYRTYEGYGDINSIRDYNLLPRSLKTAVSDFEKFTGGKVVAISVGADRKETIVR